VWSKIPLKRLCFGTNLAIQVFWQAFFRSNATQNQSLSVCLSFCFVALPPNLDRWYRPIGQWLEVDADEIKEYPNIELRSREVGLSFQVQFSSDYAMGSHLTR